MAVTLNIKEDLARHCKNLLNQEGYSVTDINSESIIKQFLTLKKHRVSTKVRRVYEAFGQVPVSLAAGYESLKAKIENGEDIWPHQSRKILNESFQDGMLLHFGIHHFHMGQGPDTRRPNLVSGTEDLLFAVVTDDAFYAIGFFHHGDWNKQELLSIVNKNWPILTETWKAKGIAGNRPTRLSVNYTDEELKELRSHQINSFVQLDDGSITLGGGLGVALDGSSIEVVLQMNKLNRTIDQYEIDIKNNISERFSFDDSNDYRLEFKCNEDDIEISVVGVVIMKLGLENIFSLFLKI